MASNGDPVVLPPDVAERLRMAIEDAVARALEAGWTVGQVRTECEYAIEAADDGE